MAEELILSYDLNRDFVKGDNLNVPVIAELTIYTSDEFVNKYPKTSCDLILAVDTSGSMDGPFSETEKVTRREAVYNAAMEMVSTLNHDDTLSLVCYDSNAVVEIDHTSAQNPEILRKKLNGINHHSGGTNFEKAFQAISILAGSSSNNTTRVVFLTDGNANEGNITNAMNSCQKLGEEGIVVDCLGVGEDFNFRLMQDFTSLANGMTRLVSLTTELESCFSELLKNAQVSLISNAVLRIQSDTELRDLEIAQYTPEIRYFGSPMSASETHVSFRQNLASLAQIYEYKFIISAKVDIPPANVSSNICFINARLDYDVPIKKLKAQYVETAVSINIQNNPDNVQNNTLLDEHFTEIQLEKMSIELNDLFANKSWADCGDLLKRMLKIAQKGGFDDKAKEFDSRLKALVKNGRLTQDDINNVSSASSKSSTAGVRQADVDDF